MSNGLRFLVAESETEKDRKTRKESTGRSSGESYAATLKSIAPHAHCDIVRPVDPNGPATAFRALSDYDGVFLTGSPLHVYKDTPEVRRQLEFMRAVFDAGTPSFGSCAGLQVAVAAAGGSVRENKRGREFAFARRIVPTEIGRSHPLLAGRPAVFDAVALHSDEVESLPKGAILLATNEVTAVQAAEVRLGDGVFWGVQYHPELPLAEIADALRRQGPEAVRQGFAREARDVESYAAMIEALGRDPKRRDLAWRLGVNEQVADTTLRRAELRNFIEHLVGPTRSGRGRG